MIMIGIWRDLFCLADGRREVALFDKITSRIFNLCDGLDLDHVDPVNPLVYTDWFEGNVRDFRLLWLFK